MPRTRECDYCGTEIEPGTGTLLVRNNGSTIDYCSSKCEKNADLGREPRDVEWTESGRRAKGPAVEQAEPAESDTEEVEADTEEADEADDADETADSEAEDADEDLDAEAEEREEEEAEA